MVGFLALSLVILVIYSVWKSSAHLQEMEALNQKYLETTKAWQESNDRRFELDQKLVSLANELFLEKEKNKEIISQKKSSETRLGQITEHLVPFLEGFKHNPKDCHFLGQPIDMIAFDLDAGEITFIEVKTGNAKESHRQKTIKNIIKAGKVYYETIRINQKGMTVKRAENEDMPNP